MWLSQPRLFTTLYLASWDSFERLQTMLARSRGLLLDVKIYHYIEVEPPGLRRMHLVDHRLSWSNAWSTSLYNLTTLELEEPGEGVWPSWSQFSTILRFSPLLRKLILRHAGPREGPDDSDNESTVSDATDPAAVPLRNLTDLVLGEETPECVYGLLRQLYIPALKRLSLDLLYYDYTFIELLAGPATLPTTPAVADGQYCLLSRLEHLRIACLSWDHRTAPLRMLYDGLHNLTGSFDDL